MARINSLIQKGYKQIRRCKGDGNCYYRAVYYCYLEILISKGKNALNTFINGMRNHKKNKFSNIKIDRMFDIIVIICEQITNKLIIEGPYAAYQHLLQSVLLIPDFDMVSYKVIE